MGEDNVVLNGKSINFGEDLNARANNQPKKPMSKTAKASSPQSAPMTMESEGRTKHEEIGDEKGMKATTGKGDIWKEAKELNAKRGGIREAKKGNKEYVIKLDKTKENMLLTNALIEIRTHSLRVQVSQNRRKEGLQLWTSRKKYTL